MRRLLPAIERSLTDNGFIYEHSGLGGVASGSLSVLRYGGRLYRLGVYPAPRWEPKGTVPSLSLDASWCGADAGSGDTFRSLALQPTTTEDEVDAVIAAAAAGFAADRASGLYGDEDDDV